MVRLSSHRLPFSLSIGSAAPPPIEDSAGPPITIRHMRGTVRMELRMGARTRLRMRAAAAWRLSYALTGTTRRRVGDALWLLGLDEDALLFGAMKAVVKKDAVDRLLDSVDAEARRWAEEATGE